MSSRFSFDDQAFGITTNGNVLDQELAQRPPGLTRAAWYDFAGELSRALNDQIDASDAPAPINKERLGGQQWLKAKRKRKRDGKA